MPSGKVQVYDPSKAAPAPAGPAPLVGENEVAVRTAGGEVGTVSRSQLRRVLESGGELVTPDDLRRAQLEEKYGGIGGTLAAGAAGVGRGLTFGGSDYLLSHMGLREDLAALQDVNQGASLGGEVVGALLPALFSGGAGGAATAGRMGLRSAAGLALRGATAPGRAVMGLGRAAEGAALRALGAEAAPGILGRVARRTAAGALGAGVEGAFQGVGSAISESAIHDKELTAEMLLAAGGKGALIGALLGGASTGATALPVETVRQAGRYIGGGLGSLRRSLTGAVDAEADLGAKILAGTAKTREAAEGVFDKGIATSAADAFQAARKTKLGETAEGFVGKGGMLPKEGEDFGQWVNRLHGETVWRSLGGTKKMTKNADRFFPGGHEEAANFIAEHAPKYAGKTKWGELDPDLMMKAGQTWEKKAGKRLGRLLDDASETLTSLGEGPTIGDVYGAAKAHAKTMWGKAGQESAARSLDDFANSVARISGALDEEGNVIAAKLQNKMDLKQLRNFRMDAENKTKYGADLTLSEQANAYKRLRNDLEDMVIEHGSKFKPTFEQAYIKAKRQFQAATMLNEAAASGKAATGTNRLISLTDTGAALTGSAIGTMLGGPVGTMAGYGLGLAANRFMRTRGQFIAADMLKKVGDLGSIERVARHIDDQIDKGVEKFIGATKATREELSAKYAPELQTAAGVGKEYLAEAKRLGKRGAELAQRTTAAAMEAPYTLSRGRTRVGYQAAKLYNQEERKRREDERNEAIRLSSSLAGLRNNFDAKTSIVSRLVGSLSSSAPELSNAASQKMMAAISNLAAVSPQLRKSGNIGGRLQAPTLNEADFIRYKSYLDGIRSPLSVLGDMAEGKLSHEKAKAVRENYPRLWSEMQSKVFDTVVSKGAQIPYEKRIQLSILFGTPMDDTMKPDFMRAVQDSKTKPPPQEQPGEGPQARPAQAKVQLDTEMYETDADKIEQGVS